MCVPVESVEHLYGDEDGEGHSHWMKVIKYVTATQRRKLKGGIGALEVVRLGRGKFEN